MGISKKWFSVELDRKPDFLIVAHPVRGLDIGATEYIHERILAEREIEDVVSF